MVFYMCCVQFFKPLVPTRVNLIMDLDGRSSGRAFADFSTHEEAVQSMEKDREYIGTYSKQIVISIYK